MCGTCESTVVTFTLLGEDSDVCASPSIDGDTALKKYCLLNYCFQFLVIFSRLLEMDTGSSDEKICMKKLQNFADFKNILSSYDQCPSPRKKPPLFKSSHIAVFEVAIEKSLSRTQSRNRESSYVKTGLHQGRKRKQGCYFVLLACSEAIKHL